MKTNSKSLNDLFREASAEARGRAEENVLSQSEIERLIRDSNVRSVPVTLGQRIYRSLFSTPLKIGMTAMTTAALIAVGFFAFWPQNNSNGIIHHNVSAANSLQKIDSLNSSHPFAIQRQGVIHFSVSRATLPGYKLAVQPLMSIKAVPTHDSLRPIEIAPDMLAKLGISLEDNGEIVIYKRERNKIDKYGLPPTWGLRMYFGGKIPDNDTAGMHISKSFPILITEPDGAKRLFSFEEDTAFTQKNGNDVMYMQMMNQTQVVPPQQVPKGLNNVPGDSTIDFVNGGVNSHSIVIAGDSAITPDPDNKMISVNVDSILRTLNLDSIFALINVDSIVQAQMPNHRLNLDSLRRASKKALLIAKNIISSMHVMVDTGKAGAIKVEVNANSDNHADSALFSSYIAQIEADSVAVHGNAIANYGVSKIQDINVDGNIVNNNSHIRIRKSNKREMMSVNGNVLPPAPPLPHIDIRQMENSLDLSKLIPIRVVNYKNPAHPNVLIFWYDPTPEVLAAVPQAGATHSEAVLMQVQTTVYPNPTPGRATLHFELYGANTASYTIRNLLGQEVMAGGTLSGSTGEVPLDFSKLDAGVYLLVSTTNGGVPDVERIVVAK